MGMARTVAAVFGAIYLFAGAVGFVVVPGGEGELFGTFQVNVLLNIVHILLGGVLLYGATSTPAAVMANRGVGSVLLVLGILGFVVPDGFGLVPLGGNDIWLHLATGAILLAAGFMGENADTRTA